MATMTHGGIMAVAKIARQLAKLSGRLPQQQIANY
jgi:hypothetical protein